MATNNKVVVGNNFNPYLVGLQFTSEGGTPLFTIGNFQITTNLTSQPLRNFQLGSFSAPITIDSLGSGSLEEATQFVNDNSVIYLNLNNENLLGHVLFGSFVKFIDATLNNIIENWPGSIYVYYSFGSTIGNTATGIFYDPVLNRTTFSVNTNFFYNYYNINYTRNAASFSATSIPNSIKNLTLYYNQYEIFINGQSYQIVGFIPSTTLSNGTCIFTVEGAPFGDPPPPNSTTSYHIKPIDAYLERFFSGLDDFSRFLLNRNTVPKYTCNIYYEEENEDYLILEKVKRFTWPVTDGYNLDRNTGDFLIYRENLLSIADNYDTYRTDLMRRTLVTDSISYFELNPSVTPYYPLNTTEKIDQLLTMYGREFDEVKKYIDGISYANTISYNKQGNTPDVLVKDFVYNLGWDLLTPMEENQLLANYIPTVSYFSGMTVGYTPAEAEVEFWRRLALNSAFLWKSKGTRKPIEFLFEFINTPPALIHFNEYIYQAKNKLDVNKFKQILDYLYNNTDISPYNIDEDGYPKVPVDTLSNYFQKGGGWYRETAGPNSQIDYYEGNNPHIGPYDAGQYYIDQFRCLLSNFSGQTIKITEEYVEFTNLFANYYNGMVNGYSGEVYADPVNLQNKPTDCIIIDAAVIDNPSSEPEYTICGCLIPSAITQAIIISVKKNPYAAVSCSSSTFNEDVLLASIIPCDSCTPIAVTDSISAILYSCTDGVGLTITTNLVPEECCRSASADYNLNWIELIDEIDDKGVGYCYYDDPCKNSQYRYLGNFMWEDISVPSSPIITNQVPKDCCLYRGGIYNELTGECKKPSG